MIGLIFGNVGSGKTASTVRWMRENKHKTIITNIKTKGKDFKHVINLKPEMVLKKELIGTKKDGKPIYDLKLNIDFWKSLVKKHKEINVVIDEAHTFFNPRRSMSKINIIMTDFLALLRRVLGTNTGQLILITQLSRRLDVIAKEMATDVQYCIHHYQIQCKKCKLIAQENNETADKMFFCPKCNSHRIERIKSIIEIYHFKSVDLFNKWDQTGSKTYYKRYAIKDIHSIFKNYDTLQWDDLLSDF